MTSNAFDDPVVQQAIGDFGQDLDRIARERDELRAQADGFYDEVQRLRAENGRLRAFVGRVVGAYAVDEWIAEEGQRLLDDES